MEKPKATVSIGMNEVWTFSWDSRTRSTSDPALLGEMGWWENFSQGINFLGTKDGKGERASLPLTWDRLLHYPKHQLLLKKEGVFNATPVQKPCFSPKWFEGLHGRKNVKEMPKVQRNLRKEMCYWNVLLELKMENWGLVLQRHRGAKGTSDQQRHLSCERGRPVCEGTRDWKMCTCSEVATSGYMIILSCVYHQIKKTKRA